MSLIKRIGTNIGLGMLGYEFLHLAVLSPHASISDLRNVKDGPSAIDSATIQRLAEYMDSNPSHASSLMGRNIRAGASPSPIAGKVPFDDGFLKLLQTQSVRDLLSSFEEKNVPELASRVDEVLRGTKEIEIEEKQRLLEIRNWLAQSYSGAVSDDVFFEIANNYYEDSEQKAMELGRAAFRYYLAMESDPERRDRKREEFLQVHGGRSDQVVVPIESVEKPSESQ